MVLSAPPVQCKFTLKLRHSKWNGVSSANHHFQLQLVLPPPSVQQLFSAISFLPSSLKLSCGYWSQLGGSSDQSLSRLSLVVTCKAWTFFCITFPCLSWFGTPFDMVSFSGAECYQLALLFWPECLHRTRGISLLSQHCIWPSLISHIMINYVKPMPNSTYLSFHHIQNCTWIEQEGRS